MAEIDYGVELGRETADQGNLTSIFHAAGAVASLALIIGTGVWGYNLLMRDVTGIPVVRAIEGPMRVQPEDPGGLRAAHQGLSVNNVAAEGTAGAPADRLVLAPRPQGLTDEDQPKPVLAAAPPPQDPPLDIAEDVLAETVASTAAGPQFLSDAPGPLEGAEDRTAAILELADRLAAGAEPLSAIAAAPAPEASAPAPRAASATPTAAVATATPAPDGPGLSRSLRPPVRPQSLTVAAAIAQPDATAQAVAAAVVEVDPATLSSGTRLVQLGAFDSPEVARAEWDRLAGRFAAYLEGKSRVVQQAQSGGRTFYRLRAMGFEDLADARRFCSALVAENAACIPVVIR